MNGEFPSKLVAEWAHYIMNNHKDGVWSYSQLVAKDFEDDCSDQDVSNRIYYYKCVSNSSIRNEFKPLEEGTKIRVFKWNNYRVMRISIGEEYNIGKKNNYT